MFKKIAIILSLPLTVLLILAFTGIAFSGSSQKGDDAGFLGVYLSDLNQGLRESLDYKGKGAFINDIVADAPAEKAGIEAGDIVIKYGKFVIDDSDELREVIRKTEPGEKVKIIVIREGKKKKLVAKIGERDDSQKFSIQDKDYGDDEQGWKYVKPHIVDIPRIPPIYIHSDKDDERGFLGVNLDDLSEGLAEYFGVEHGALVTDVIKESPAEKAGLKAGDVIIEFDSREVEEENDVHYFIRKTIPGDVVKVIVNRRGEQKTFEVELGETPEKYHSYDESLDDYYEDLGKLEIDLGDLDGDLEGLQDLEKKLKDIQIKIGDNKKTIRIDTKVAN